MLRMRKDYLPFGRPNYSGAEVSAAARVIRSAWVGMGKETIAFEEELAAYVGAPYAVAVNSCTSALFLALAAKGIGPGDEVICPSMTWCSTANAVLYLRARPVFCDVDPHTLCLTPEAVARKLTARTRAVMAVHYGGSVIDVQALRRRLPKGVFIVEDAAHALGGAYPDGSRAGSSGNLACFSFYPNKNLATAEGGAVALRDGRLADRLRSLRQHALPINAWRRFTDPKTLLLSGGLTELGYKMNFTDLQAAIARVQLRRQPSLDARRRAIASVYARRIGRAGLGLELQRGLTDAAHARHLAVLMLPSHLGGAPRDGLLRELRVRNIGAAIHYAPLHRMALYGRRPRRLPVTEDVYPRILTLPISASMTTVDAEYVCEHLLDILGSLTGR